MKDNIGLEIIKYYLLYTVLANSINTLADSIKTLDDSINTLDDSINTLKTQISILRFYIEVAIDFTQRMYNSILNLKYTNIRIYNATNSNYNVEKLKIYINKEIEDLKNLTEADSKILKLNGGRKKPTKPKPKHDDMTMKDIKELCKANQIKLSRVVEDKHIVYNKKELLAKLLDAKIANAKPSDGHKKPTKQKPKGKHDDMKMKDINELCKANQIKLSRVVEGKRIAYKKKELITKLKRKKLL